MSTRFLAILWRLAQPVFLLGSIALALLGLGVARFLGEGIMDGRVLVGLGWLVSLQLGGALLWGFVHSGQSDPGSAMVQWVGDISQADQLHLRAASLASFAFAAFCGYFLLVQSPGLLISGGFLLAGFVLAAGYSLPPLRLETSGLGEYAISVAAGMGIPLYFYYLTAGRLTLLVAVSAGMLPLLICALLVILQLQSYASDLKYERTRILVRLGWEMGIGLHNALLVGAFVWLVGSMWLGVPKSIAMPVLLLLPLAGYQVLQLRRLEDGAPPNWPAIRLAGLSIVLGAIYLLGFGFWIR